MNRLPPRLSRLTAFAAVAALSPLAAQAQFAYTPPPLRDTSSSPYYLGVSQSISYDSNVFRDQDGPLVTSDNIYTTGLRLGIDQPISRQRIVADALVQYNKYQDQTQLDNTSYGINLRGDFETVNNISGDVHYTRAEYQAPFQDNRSTARITTRNRLSLDEVGLRVQYGMRAKWILEGTALYRTQSYSNIAYAYQEQNEATFGVNAKYRPSDLLSLGVGVRASHGELPNYVASASAAPGDTYDRQDIDLLGNWQLSGLTSLNGRISATRTRFDKSVERNYSGITGELGANYRPTGRLNLYASFNRETNDAGTQYTTTLPSSTISVTRLQDTRISNALRLQATYDLTGKIKIDTAVRYVYRSLKGIGVVDGAGNLVGTSSGSDRTAGIAIGASYTITRAWSAACSVGRDRRSTDLTGAYITYPYGVTTASCSAQLTLR